MSKTAMTKTAKEYMENVYHALMGNRKNLMQLYEGKNGCLRLAREFGYGFNDFPKDQHRDIISSSYGYLCVRFYNLKPPVDAKDWVKEIISQIN